MNWRHGIGMGLAAMAGLVFMAASSLAEAPAPLRKLTVGAATSWFTPDVSPEDVKWPAPPADGMKNAPIFGYAHRWKPGQPVPNAERVQMPLYRNFDSDDPKWWDEQLDEVLFTRPALIFLIGRGCTKPEDSRSFVGPGNMCPYKLRMMVDAVRRSAAEDAARFALFVDTGATFALRRSFTRKGPERLDEARSSDRDPNTRFDLSDRPDSSGRAALWYFWDATVRPWFDTVPKEMWYLFDDNGVKKPVIAFWGITHRFTGHRGNTTKLLRDLKAKFVERYGVEPFFIVSTAWITGDPSLAEVPGLVGGVHDWFRPRFGEPTPTLATSRWIDGQWRIVGKPDGISSLAEWRGKLWGAAVPGFDCGSACNVPPVSRQEGRSLEIVLEKNRNSSINIIEGFNGPIEGTALYRSKDQNWSTVNQYLNIIRKFNDPSTHFTKFQIEAADRLNIQSTAQGGSAFVGQPGVSNLPGIGETGEWGVKIDAASSQLSYERLYLASGRYDIIVRAKSLEKNAEINILVDQQSTSARLLAPPDNYMVIQKLEGVDIESGLKNITIRTSGTMILDWIILQKRKNNQAE